jgi:hypothetical protein
MIADLERRLGFQEEDTFVLLGSYRAPVVEYTSPSWSPDDHLLLSPGEGVAGNYLVDHEITFFLPRGKATRWKLEPRILVFREIPGPRAAAGAVFEILDERWVLDSRGASASLVLEIQPMLELVIIGVNGTVHLLHVLRDEPRGPGDVLPAVN